MANRTDARLASTCIEIIAPWEGKTLDAEGIRAIADTLRDALGTTAPDRIAPRLSSIIVDRVVRKALGVERDRFAYAPSCRKSKTTIGLAYVVGLADPRECGLAEDLPSATALADRIRDILDRSGIDATVEADPRGFSRDIVVVRPG